MKEMRKTLVVMLSLVAALCAFCVPAIAFAADDGQAEAEYVYGQVEMNYADFYYGELEGIEPSAETAIPESTVDPVTAAGYREEGYYDAATFATPKGFIYEKKWQGWPGTYSEPIYDEAGILVGGKILGVSPVNVAVLKSVYEAAMAAPDSVVGKKAAEIVLLEDQSAVPLSYKVLNADGVYSKFVNLTESVETALDGICTTEYMGDDIWWEGRAMKHTADQTILGGIIEWKKNPADPDEQPVVLGLKHNENMYSDSWIGWGMGPGNVGIYGGNETGWQRFSGISGNYLTKMSYILMEEDGSVHYYNATSETGILNPLIPSGIVDENGNHPYKVEMTSYSFTADRIIMDFTLDVPTRPDGTPEVDYAYLDFSCPGGSVYCYDTYNADGTVKRAATYKSNPEKFPVYEESEYVNGHKTIHIELSRDYYGTGRYKYWFDPDKSAMQEGDRSFGGIAVWRMLYPEQLTHENVFLQDNKLVIDNADFKVADYINNPYQQIEITGSGTTKKTCATGDANTNKGLFAGAVKQDGVTKVPGLFYADGSINKDAQLYSYNRRTGVETLTPVFPNGADETYEVVMYSGGFPIVKGTLDFSKDQAATDAATELMAAAIADPTAESVATASAAFNALTDAQKAPMDNELVAKFQITVAVADPTAENVAAAAAAYDALVDQLNNDVEQAQKTAEEAQEALTDAQAALAEAQAAADQAQTAADEAQAAAEQKAAEAEAAQAAADEAQKALEEAQKKLEQTQKELEQAKKDLEEAQKAAEPAEQTITAKGLSKTFKAKQLKKAKKTFEIKASAETALSYKVTKKNAKLKFKNGKVTVKKGTKKGTYSMQVKITAKANAAYQSAEKTVTIKVKVK